MTKMTKRAFSLLLTLTLLITILPYNVWADEQQKSDSRQNENNVTLSYMVVDKPKIEKNDTQNIVVGYTISGNLQINNAVMYYTNKESGEEYEVNAVYIDNEVAKFTYDIDVNNSGEYSVSRLIFFYGDNSQEILMSDTGIDAKYAVNIDINTSPDAYLTEEETVDTDITYETIDEEGDKVECNSIEDAITVASDNKNDIETADYDQNELCRSNGNIVVVLDPGHGGNDSGTISNVYGVQIVERDINLKIAQYCKSELETYAGVTVYMTRNDNTSPNTDREQRAKFAAEKGANVLVSIHINSNGKGYTSAHGAEVYYPNSNYNSTVSGQGQNLSAVILKQLTALGLADRGIKIRNSEDGETYPDGSLADYLGINKYAKLYGYPGILIEHAYANNVSDAANYLTTDAQLQRLGVADATGIAQYFGLQKKKNVSLYGIYKQETVEGISAALSYFTDDSNIKFRWMEYNIDKGQWKILDDWSSNSSVFWKPQKGNYWLSVDTLTSDGVKQNFTLVYTSNHDYTGKHGVTISGLYCEEKNDGIHAGAVHLTNDPNTKYRWLVYDLYRKNWRVISDWKSSEWVTWKPEQGDYWLRAEAVTSDGIEDDYTLTYTVKKDYTGIKLYGIYALSGSKDVAAAVSYSSSNEDIEFRWMLYDMTSGQWEILKDWGHDTSLKFLPKLRTYWLSVDVRSKEGAVKNCTITYTSSIDYTVNYINLNGIYCSYSKYGISAGAVHQTNDDNVRYRWLYYNVDNGNWYMLTNWQKSEWLNWVPDAGHYWLRVEARLSNGKEYNSTIAYNVDKYAIMGNSDTSISQMVRYFNAKAKYPSYYSNTDAPTIEKFCQIYFEECNTEGVKAEVAFCQCMKETNFLKFTGDVNISQFNFAGIGATGNGNKGSCFENVRTGIRAQIQHLKAYGSKQKLVNTCVDPRYNLMSNKGCAVYVEWLGMHENPQGIGWASSYDYGYSIRRDYMNVLFRY